MKNSFCVAFLVLGGCVSKTVCGLPEDSRIVFASAKTCDLRIRKVTIGSDLGIPAAMRSEGLTRFAVRWVDPKMEGAELHTGHFVLDGNQKETSK